MGSSTSTPSACPRCGPSHGPPGPQFSHRKPAPAPSAPFAPAGSSPRTPMTGGCCCFPRRGKRRAAVPPSSGRSSHIPTSAGPFKPSSEMRPLPVVTAPVPRFARISAASSRPSGNLSRPPSTLHIEDVSLRSMPPSALSLPSPQTTTDPAASPSRSPAVAHRHRFPTPSPPQNHPTAHPDPPVGRRVGTGPVGKAAKRPPPGSMSPSPFAATSRVLASTMSPSLLSTAPSTA
eukprot:RCo048271